MISSKRHSYCTGCERSMAKMPRLPYDEIIAIVMAGREAFYQLYVMRLLSTSMPR